MHKLIKSSCQVFGFIATVVLFKYLQYTFLGVNSGECTMVTIGVGTAAIGAGASMYGAKKSASALEKARKPVNLTRATRNMLGAYQNTLPEVTEFEKEYRPKFQGLNLGDTSAFLQGTGGQAGLYQQTEGATNEMQRQLNAARANELAQQTGQAEQVRGLFKSLSPEAAARVQQAQDQAMQSQGLAALYQGQSQGYVNQANMLGNEAFARRGYLSPEQIRNAEQQARGSAQAAGRVGGNLGIASEIMNRENALASRRGEATSAGLNAYQQFQTQQNMMGNLRGEAQNANFNAYQMGNEFYAQPGLEALNRTPAGYAAGQEQLKIGLNQIGQGSPKLFDYGQAFNIAGANAQNATAAASANAQIDASNNASMMSLFKDAASAYGSYAQNQPAPPRARVVGDASGRVF
jgi:precorrin-6B methylase 2